MTDVLCSCHEPGQAYPVACNDPNAYVRQRAADYGIPTIRLLSAERSRWLVKVRARVATELRMYGYSLPEIGRALRRHHTTVLHLLLRETEAA